MAGPNALYSFALVSPAGDVERLRLDPTDHQDAALSETVGGELYVRRADGSDTARHVGGRPEGPDDYATQWLEDGTILFDGQVAPDIYMTSATEGGPAVALLEADWVEMAPKVSPDGRWFAYMSNEDAGVPHMFLRRWPRLDGKTQLTSGETGIIAGDNGLVWSADSRTLYFLRGRRLWTAMLASGDSPRFELGDTGVDMPGPLWDRHPDGRLLVHLTADETGGGDDAQSARLVVVANWIRALEERVGGRVR